MRGMMVMVSVIGFVASCMPTAVKVDSKRSPALNEPLHDLFVISQVGSEDEASPDDFEQTLVEGGKSCGVRIGISRISKLELDTQATEQHVKDFGAAYVLAFDLTASVISERTDKIQQAAYDARLFLADTEAQAATHSLLWRATLRIKRRSDYRSDQGKVLARSLIQQLNDDHVIEHCKQFDKPHEIAPPFPE